jgi:hypothetical protein
MEEPTVSAGPSSEADACYLCGGVPTIRRDVGGGVLSPPIGRTCPSW